MYHLESSPDGSTQNIGIFESIIVIWELNKLSQRIGLEGRNICKETSNKLITSNTRENSSFAEDQLVTVGETLRYILKAV